jgi:uncharacterized protein with PIN domain
VTLFAFGRTLHCTCGARVGLAHRVAARPARPRRFAADAMLGSLARWLRMLGFDTWWEAHVPDEALVRRALREGRTILTRDRRLPEEWRVEDVHHVEAEGGMAQLREVVARFDLLPEVRLFTRCSRCNEPLEVAPPAAAAGRVPARILASGGEIRRCPSCGRVYWEGSHTDRMRRVVDALHEDARRAR